MAKAKDRNRVMEERGLAEGIRRDWGKCEKHVEKLSVKNFEAKFAQNGSKRIQTFFIPGPFNTENSNIYFKPKTR
jgi:hypothetical protein